MPHGTRVPALRLLALGALITLSGCVGPEVEPDTEATETTGQPARLQEGDESTPGARQAAPLDLAPVGPSVESGSAEGQRTRQGVPPTTAPRVDRDAGTTSGDAATAQLPDPVAERPPTIALQHIAVRGQVVGGIADVEVEQHYANTLGERIEAVYVFPLPEDAAIREMIMVIGERRIRADLLEREAARETYEAARDQGQTTSLLEQERPNIFTMSVANIEPGLPITVLVRYVEPLEYRDGKYHFAFPTVVGPRFIPGEPTGHEGEGVLHDTAEVPDASRITPVVLPEGERVPYEIDFVLDVFAGMAIRDVISPSHSLIAEWATERAVRLSLPSDERHPDRDIALTFALADDQPAAGVLSHRDERGGYFTLMLEPPTQLADEDIRPKEIVFVIDMSGSMSGQPLELAKETIRHSVAHLNPDDTFQIVRFSSEASTFSPGPLANTPDNVAAGLAYVDALSGQGGTRMVRGIEAALSPRPDPRRLRVVLFLTDGYIGNETSVLRVIEEHLGEARLFSLGLGSSPNRFLLDEMARVGRGSANYVGIDEAPDEAVEAFYRRVRNPVLTDIEVDWGGLDVHSTQPDPIPDVFEGGPLTLSGRYDRPGAGTITIRGRRGSMPIELLVDAELTDRSANGALPYVWAQREIDAISRGLHHDRSRALREAVLPIALEYDLLTAFTSFVAVDERISADATDPLRTVGVPVALPDGVSGANIGPQIIGGGSDDGDEAGELAFRRVQGVGSLSTSGSGRGGSGRGYGTVRLASPSPQAAGSGPLAPPPVQMNRISERSRDRSQARDNAQLHVESDADSADAEEAAPAEIPVEQSRLAYADLLRVVVRQRAELNACLVEPADGPSSAPSATRIRLQIGSGGRVTDIRFLDARDLTEAHQSCLRRVLDELRFDTFSGAPVWFVYTVRP